MTPLFNYFPAHAVRPFIKSHGKGIIFSTVFHRAGEHGLQLIHIPDGKTIYISLTDEYRVGKVYSVFITPFDDTEWMYRYRSGEFWVVDPYAFSIRKIGVLEDNSSSEKTEVTACGCSPLRADSLFSDAPERPLPPVDWKNQLIYGIHIKGFTAAKPEDFPGRGTFEGVTAMIPYLKKLDVTAVELMPVYTPLPDLSSKKAFRTMQEALGAWPTGPQGDPLRDMKKRPNYWGFGRGLYFALRPEYGTQQQFALMIRDLHKAGIRVILQIYFENSFSASEQTGILRSYIDRYGVDGFRLLGAVSSPAAIASMPSLADTALFYDSFPFEQLSAEEEAGAILHEQDLDSLFPADSSAEEESSGEDSRDSASESARNNGRVRPRGTVKPHAASFPNLITTGGDYQTLLRRFVKSDDYVMKDFLKLFLGVSENHGELRTVTGYEGFTLADLVSYNERHNEANGEFGLDGRAENYSWNCGAEGPSFNGSVLSLRKKQMRNFLTLLMLSQGTPLLQQGDERCNSQGGNNNPYCQDNEISWVDWQDSEDSRAFTDFTAKLAAFRRDHPVFRNTRPFQYIDYYGIGYPDVSLHGAEAWKPDLGAFSHSIGISFCEDYADQNILSRKNKKGTKFSPSFIYLAINMYWEELPIALPSLPAGYVWKMILDTDTEEGFLSMPSAPSSRRQVSVAPRSVKILRAVPDPDSIEKMQKEERLRNIPPVGAVLRDLRKSGSKNRRVKSSKYPARTLRLMKTMIRPSISG